MPWVKPIKQKEMKEYSNGEAVGVFDRLLANDPDTYQSFLPLQKAVKRTDLSEDLREAIITFVSMKNGCKFCTKSHSEILATYVDEPDLLGWLKEYERSDMNDVWKAVLTYADHLVSKPVKVTKEDIVRLKDTGFDEKGIVEINQTIAYTSYTNQLSMGLGL
ncbi:hypothetical protein H0266_09410 [Halobacillus locisalis]|uniref:Alkylhydroperoxidase AhpD family core domain-containing protein n=1 Tax=Halobacillus locisalis TaxID=220753 RepID=A0A838CTG7_9BACI|nr:hypothetical protein [Halobacillus locisalis]MBA2175109.1 hypothetical protein [Halobacillus locisalis]